MYVAKGVMMSVAKTFAPIVHRKICDSIKEKRTIGYSVKGKRVFRLSVCRNHYQHSVSLKTLFIEFAYGFLISSFSENTQVFAPISNFHFIWKQRLRPHSQISIKSGKPISLPFSIFNFFWKPLGPSSNQFWNFSNLPTQATNSLGTIHKWCPIC